MSAVFPLSSPYVKVYSDYVNWAGNAQAQGLDYSMLPIKSVELQAEIGREIYSHLKIILAWLNMIAPEERKADISQRTDSSVHLQARKMETPFQLKQMSRAVKILTAQMN